MNISFPHANRVLAAGLAVGSLLFVSACSTTTGASAPSGRTIRQASPSGLTTRTIEHANSLCVTGTIRRQFGHALPAGAHVDIEVLDRSGRVIATRQDAIDPVHPRIERRRAGQYSYAVCFPRPAEEGWTVRVSYHTDAHS